MYSINLGICYSFIFFVIHMLLYKKEQSKEITNLLDIFYLKFFSFKNITQKDCNLIMNNINSLWRDSLNGKSLYEATLFLCDKDVLKLLDCYYIEPYNIYFTNNLLNK